jgi:hypothetical protein
MSKRTLAHLFGCVSAVICVVTSFFAFSQLGAAVSGYLVRKDPTESLLLIFHPSMMGFGAVGLGTLCMTILAFEDKIGAAMSSPLFHPLLRLLGREPPASPKRTVSGRSFFNLNAWQIGGILAVLLFVVGLGWYHLPSTVETKIEKTYTEEYTDPLLPSEPPEAVEFTAPPETSQTSPQPSQVSPEVLQNSTDTFQTSK